MFTLFKKKSEKEILQKKYEKLMKEAHSLSTTNRKLSDTKVFEAEEVLKQMDKIT
ncbi:Lacal_2735 family protein [Maribacter algarum]|uniref:Lacal_2735 family protein n=1 Tax=Maribacter algarum (ex Zhang et al. 2020) TaxID=2578118 RepID=A0A5S3PWQ2_9FLAO|nr:Lacal_2735 family protein [Maribacter algarum]TMM59328.1 Lacal_2735 family protein [Maribacter algarum]